MTRRQVILRELDALEKHVRAVIKNRSVNGHRTGMLRHARRVNNVIREMRQFYPPARSKADHVLNRLCTLRFIIEDNYAGAECDAAARAAALLECVKRLCG